MALGDTHDKATLFFGIPFAIAVHENAPWGWLGVAALTGTYIWSGLMFNGDLDTRSKVLNRWGWFKFIWTPYRKHSRHRGLSHWPVLGSLMRLLYITWLPAIAAISYIYFTESWLGLRSTLYWLLPWWRQAISAFVAIEAGAASHYLVDLVWTIKREVRKRLLW